MTILEEISAAVQEGDKKGTEALVQQAIDQSIPAQTILNDALVPAMDIVGDKFSRNEIFVPEMLVAARAMNAATVILKPLLAAEGSEVIGKAVIGTIKGDLHDIGKSLVRMMLEGKGIEVIDLGVDVPPQKFIDAVNIENPEIVAMSALLTTTMGDMKDTIEALVAAGVRDGRIIMVGGAPITENFSQLIGADIYAPDAGSAAVAAAEALKKG